jgi:hypothetical protein
MEELYFCERCSCLMITECYKPEHHNIFMTHFHISTSKWKTKCWCKRHNCCFLFGSFLGFPVATLRDQMPDALGYILSRLSLCLLANLPSFRPKLSWWMWCRSDRLFATKTNLELFFQMSSRSTQRIPNKFWWGYNSSPKRSVFICPSIRRREWRVTEYCLKLICPHQGKARDEVISNTQHAYSETESVFLARHVSSNKFSHPFY